MIRRGRKVGSEPQTKKEQKNGKDKDKGKGKRRVGGEGTG